MNLTTIPLPML